MKKIEVPLFPITKQIGRPFKYDFTPFKKTNTKYVVFLGLTEKNYDSLRSTFARWRRREGIEGRFEYDILPSMDGWPPCITIWRQGEKISGAQWRTA